MPVRFTPLDIGKVFFQDFDSAQGGRRCVLDVSERKLVAQEGNAGCGLLAEVIQTLGRYNHLGIEVHPLRIVLADPMKQTSDVAGASALVSNRHRGVEQRMIRKRTQKADCIEEVGLADAVGAGNACERAEADVDIDQILEAGHPQPRKHVGFAVSVNRNRRRGAQLASRVCVWVGLVVIVVGDFPSFSVDLQPKAAERRRPLRRNPRTSGYSAYTPHVCRALSC